ncbi:HxlR family transcriptional regulator [Lentzea atacamensis]|uniref:HxlR family transcriptional regulator n=1 Tax=Lentzea atacamensis TaxID=531938 RepID=A0A316I3E4_9PSEU|nr:helix-turn-helix domain-containing protein [Lentzea atacamensis]PWK87174.1 HxlR family transcriptional regulator [Lentzea atacamensis]
MPMQMSGPLAALDKWQPDRCSMAMALDVVGTKSAMLLLREAFYGTTRFDGFVRRVGITEAVAAKRLKELVKHGLLEKRPYREPGSRTRYEYVLTEMGNALLPVVVALMQWGDTYLRDDGGPLRVVAAETGEPVSVRVAPSGAESLGPEGLAVRISRKG